MMNIESFRKYCLSKKAVTESFPFDEHTLVFKVANKMFALTSLDSIDFRVNLKCDPDRALELRDTFPDLIIPGYHMNKKLWNTVIIEGTLTQALFKELVDHSYDLVVASLTKKVRLVAGL